MNIHTPNITKTMMSEFNAYVTKQKNPDDTKIEKKKIIVTAQSSATFDYSHRTDWVSSAGIKNGFGTVRVEIRLPYSMYKVLTPYIRFTTNNWETFYDITNLHSHTQICRDNNYRIFIDVPLFETCVFKYVIFFKIPHNDDQVWDNNEGKNYEIMCDLKTRYNDTYEIHRCFVTEPCS
jgi:hypothetical protein